MSVCTGTEANALNINYTIRFVELKVRETDIYEILQQRCGKHHHITASPSISGAITTSFGMHHVRHCSKEVICYIKYWTDSKL